MARKKIKLIYKILIVVGVLLSTYLGGFIHGRSSVEKYSTEYTRQLRNELSASTESNRQLRDYYSELEEENRRFRETNEQFFDAIGYDFEELEEGVTITRKLIENCIELVKQLREIYSETQED